MEAVLDVFAVATEADKALRPGKVVELREDLPRTQVVDAMRVS